MSCYDYWENDAALHYKVLCMQAGKEVYSHKKITLGALVKRASVIYASGYVNQAEYTIEDICDDIRKEVMFYRNTEMMR